MAVVVAMKGAHAPYYFQEPVINPWQRGTFMSLVEVGRAIGGCIARACKHLEPKCTVARKGFAPVELRLPRGLAFALGPSHLS